jgi:hypothetical protein
MSIWACAALRLMSSLVYSPLFLKLDFRIRKRTDVDFGIIFVDIWSFVCTHHWFDTFLHLQVDECKGRFEISSC